MATKKQRKGATKQAGEKFPRKFIPVKPGETEKETWLNHAAVTIAPEVAAYRVINGAELKSGMGEFIDVPALMGQLRGQAEAINNGDLRQAEAMLISQATALQSLFARLAEKSMSTEYLANFEAFMRMALRAQSQCRATLETLALIKNPRQVAFVKQANIANGPQQVNNGAMPEASPARENENQPNKLLEADNGEWMDTGTASAASGTDKEMATVGEIDGAKDH